MSIVFTCLAAGGSRRTRNEYIGVTTDVTGRVQSETALKRSEERYALAMSASEEGHWDWNIAADEFYASPRMLEMYGFPPGTRFAGRSDFLARFPYHPDDRPKWEAAAAAHFASASARFELEIRMIPRAETRWIHLTGICSRDASGRPERLTGSATDVTERKCAELALRDLTGDLKEFDVPTLILHGDGDQIVPIADSALLSSKIVKGAILKVYEGTPHGMRRSRIASTTICSPLSGGEHLCPMA